MNIVPKLYGGGDISSLFTTYRPVQTPQVQAPQSVKLSNSDKESLSIKSSSKDEDKENTKGELTEKDLFNMIKDVDGLPNEMKSIITDLKRTLATKSLVGIDTGELANTYLSSLYKLKVANQNKKRFDESIKDAKELFNTISDSVNGLKEGLDNITQLNEAMDTNRNNVVSKMEDVAAVATETAAASEEVTASAVDVEQTMHDLNEFTVELDNIAEALKEAIDKFKLQ